MKAEKARLREAKRKQIEDQLAAQAKQSDEGVLEGKAEESKAKAEESESESEEEEKKQGAGPHTSIETGHADASLTYPQQAVLCRKGTFVVIKGQPCKVVETSTSKTGKHGHAKIHFIALNIFNGRKLEMIEASSHNVECPVIKRSELQVMGISDDLYLQLLLEDGGTKEDIKMEEGELLEKMRKGLADGKTVVASILAAMGEEKAVDCQIVD